MAAGPVDRARSGSSRFSLAVRAMAFLAIVFLAGAAQAQRPAAATHIVRPGETLGLIAQQYGVDIFALASANGIRDAHRIYSWQQLTIPRGSAPTDAAIVAQGRHVVRPGESLDSIAKQYGIALSDLIALNNIYGWIYPGDELALQIPGQQPAPVPIDSPVEASGITHRVKFGESLAKIAAAYGVPLYDLQTLNDIWTSILFVGQEVQIPAGGSSVLVSELPEDPATPDASTAVVEPEPPVETSGMTHRVLRGESLARIAAAYGVSLYDLQTLNDIWTSILYVGQEVEIPASVAPVPEAERPAETEAADESPATPKPEPAVEASGITHKVRFGESLSKIAAAYGVSLYDLQTLNDVWTWVIYVGQELEIPAGGRPPEVRDVPPESEPEPEPEATVKDPQSASPETHTVQRGETLFSIAKRYDVSLDALMRANGIQDATRIHAGNTLRVSRLDVFTAPAPSNDAISPAPAQSAPPPAAAPAGRAIPVVTISPAPGVYPAGNMGQYTVGRGEYLTELGVRFNMEWRVLAKINGISPPGYKLHPQQTLRIPSFAEYLSYLPDNSSYKLFYTTHHHPGPRVGVGREIVIELGRQSIYAYENGVLKKRALMSSGKMVTPTVLGDYEIYRKYRSQTMSGPGYSLDNVEWPMYFYAGYAIHGTWWHTMFGTPMSHGCVNLTNSDAQWFWEFAPLGTPVHVRH